MNKVSAERRHLEIDTMMMNINIREREKRMELIKKGVLKVKYSRNIFRCVVMLYGMYLGHLPRDRDESINMLNMVVRTIEITRWKGEK